MIKYIHWRTNSVTFWILFWVPHPLLLFNFRGFSLPFRRSAAPMSTAHFLLAYSNSPSTLNISVLDISQKGNNTMWDLFDWAYCLHSSFMSYYNSFTSHNVYQREMQKRNMLPWFAKSPPNRQDDVNPLFPTEGKMLRFIRNQSCLKNYFYC